MMEVTREHFDKLLEKYLEYVELYKFFNNGKIDGVTPFGQFYWRMTFLIKYQDAAKVGSNA